MPIEPAGIERHARRPSVRELDRGDIEAPALPTPERLGENLFVSIERERLPSYPSARGECRHLAKQSPRRVQLLGRKSCQCDRR